MSKDDIYINKSTEELKEVRKHLIALNPQAVWNPVYEALTSEIKRRDNEQPPKQYLKSNKTLNENVSELFEKPNLELEEAAKRPVKANDLALEGQLFHIISEAALAPEGVPIPKEALEKLVKKLDGLSGNVIADGFNIQKEKDKVAKEFKLDIKEFILLTTPMLKVIVSSDYDNVDLKVKAAAAKVALYQQLLPENETSKKISEVLSDYVSNTKVEPQKLRDDVYMIASPVINKKNPIEAKGLKDDSARIVDTFTDKKSSFSFVARVAKIWRSFIDSLPTLREASKVCESIANYTTNKKETMAHRSVGKQKEQEQSR